MVAPERIGRYEVDGILGHGGFATVYSAVDPMLDARVAVKLLAENWCLDPDVRQRFVQEAQIMWRSDDEHIVRVHTVGETDDGRPYFVMQLADRGSLADRVAAAAPAGLSPDVAVDIASRLADAVDVVHRLGFVHRDLKPSNVLFHSPRAHDEGTSDDDILMLADLGLAKALSDASGLASSVGTPSYMAPEQRDPSRGADERSDIYSLGVITYELLTGGVPVAGTDARASLGAIPGLAPATIDVVASALEPRSDRRPQSAAAFRDALGRSQDFASVGVPSGQRALTRRRQWALPSLVVVLVAVAGAVALATSRPDHHAALTVAGSAKSAGSVVPTTTPRGDPSSTTRRGETSTTNRRGHPATTVVSVIHATTIPSNATPDVTTPIVTSGTTPVVPIVTAAPVARFTVSPPTVREGQPVTLHSTSNTGVTSWKWDLGDGRTRSGPTVTVSWSDPRIWTVTLTATGPGGDAAISHVVTVKPPLPTVHVEQKTTVVRGKQTFWSVTWSNTTGGTWTLTGSPKISLSAPQWTPGTPFQGTFNVVGATYVLSLTAHNSAGETAKSSVTFTVVAS